MNGRGLQKEPSTSLARSFSRSGGSRSYGSAGERRTGRRWGWTDIFRPPRNGVFATPAPPADFMGSPHLLFSSPYSVGPSLVPPSGSAIPILLRLLGKRCFPSFLGLSLLALGFGEVLWRPLVQNPFWHTDLGILNPNLPSSQTSLIYDSGD